MNKYHTGESASNLKGLYIRDCCSRSTRMIGGYKDVFPPCGKCKVGTYYTKFQITKRTN